MHKEPNTGGYNKTSFYYENVQWVGMHFYYRQAISVAAIEQFLPSLSASDESTRNLIIFLEND
ncbi:hypothetical protein A4H97_29515 [Niastella yeongjuensis]|uniref:Uncharacterized protein n=1 Tax=Niastella yeongjuensis TaxID=354355 RepID=A0A1V9ES78_9BACT|nr:hypothetical protein A4H97_29515 [Niastella yeongjuensis]SEP10629.1 hypothetical protein SAMN05660816_04400 [Niastella yeongjuensis]